MADNQYDAIVVGSGISGGWAAKELTEKGLKASVIVSLGYRSETDFNAKLPKSRLTDDVIFTRL